MLVLISTLLKSKTFKGSVKPVKMIYMTVTTQDDLNWL